MHILSRNYLLSSVTALAVLGASSARAADPAPAPAAAAPAAIAAPRPGFDLSRLAQLEAGRLTPLQRHMLAIRLFQDEQRAPTPLPRTATDPVTHDYVMAAITQKFADTHNDVDGLRRAWGAQRPGELRDCMALCIALKGVPAFRATTVAYLQNTKNPMRLRALAAKALGEIGAKQQDAKVGEVLWPVVRADLMVQYVDAPPAPARGPGRAAAASAGAVATFPVREAAAAAVRRMERAGLRFPSYIKDAVARVERANPGRQAAGK